MTLTVKHPHVTVQLTGRDGNAFAIMGAVSRALKKAGTGDHGEYLEAAMSAESYDDLLAITLGWVDVS